MSSAIPFGSETKREKHGRAPVLSSPLKWKCPDPDHQANNDDQRKCTTNGCSYYRTDIGIGLACSGGGIFKSTSMARIVN